MTASRRFKKSIKFNIIEISSDPMEEDNWKGYVSALYNEKMIIILASNEDPQKIEYYMCGPPMMNTAVTKMLEDLGVEEDTIDYDDFVIILNTQTNIRLLSFEYFFSMGVILFVIPNI